jgi:hypothetical protein
VANQFRQGFLHNIQVCLDLGDATELQVEILSMLLDGTLKFTHSPT